MLRSQVNKECLRVHCAVLNARTSNSPGSTCSQSYGGHGERETPGNIPNPEAKPLSADGTALETGWESRTPPDNHSRRGPSSRWGPFVVPTLASVTGAFRRSISATFGTGQRSAAAGLLGSVAPTLSPSQSFSVGTPARPSGPRPAPAGVCSHSAGSHIRLACSDLCAAGPPGRRPRSEPAGTRVRRSPSMLNRPWRAGPPPARAEGPGPGRPPPAGSGPPGRTPAASTRRTPAAPRPRSARTRSRPRALRRDTAP